MIVVDGFGEELRRIVPFAARAVLRGDEEDLVHSHVECVGLEDVDEFVEEVEDDGVDLRMLRAPTAAVDVVVVRELAGRFVEFRVLDEQREGGFTPRLVAQALELRDQADAVVAADLDQRADAICRDGIVAAQFGVGREGVAVVDSP